MARRIAEHPAPTARDRADHASRAASPRPAPRLPARPSPARDRLVRTAMDLFYARGINSVGIDQIIEAAGVAKMTLYGHFKSKDDLLAACIELRDAHMRSAIAAAMGPSTRAAGDRISAVFEALAHVVTASDFRGCPFLNAAAEIADPSHPARKAALAHKEWMRSLLLDLSRDANLPRPEALANQLSLLVNGLLSSASAYAGVPGAPARAADAARQAARALLTAAGGR